MREIDTSLKPGSRLYRIEDGVLRKVTFRRYEKIAGCAGEYAMFYRNENGIICRSTDAWYVPSEREAWESYLKEFEADLTLAELAVARAQVRVDWVKAEIARVKELISTKWKEGGDGDAAGAAAGNSAVPG